MPKTTAVIGAGVFAAVLVVVALVVNSGSGVDGMTPSVDDGRRYNAPFVSSYPSGGGYNANTIADYQFNGNAQDTSGVNHGTISGAVQYVPDRNGAQNAAAYFNGRDAFITVQAPFPNADTAFTIAVWLKPTLIDAGWHGFVGYHSDLGGTMECCCPHRSPSMWVARAVEDGSALHYDSCEKTGRGQVGASLDHLVCSALNDCY